MFNLKRVENINKCIISIVFVTDIKIVLDKKQ